MNLRKGNNNFKQVKPFTQDKPDDQHLKDLEYFKKGNRQIG